MPKCLIIVNDIGLAVAADYETGQKMIRDRSFEVNLIFFRNNFDT